MPSVDTTEPMLLGTDFDGAYALTQEAAPNGMNVERAYEFAIERLFGSEALDRYVESGGLYSRAPGEIVVQLAPELEGQALRARTEDLIHIKLSVLENQIGKRFNDDTGDFWPRIAPGFKPVWEQISVASGISTAVISSGHSGFIRRFHEVHGIEQPDIMVTDDDMRPLSRTHPVEQIVKPSPLILQKAYLDWLWLRGFGMSNLKSDTKGYENVIYVGDDAVKDGRLAENFHVDFILIDRDNYPASWRKVGELLLPEVFGSSNAE